MTYGGGWESQQDPQGGGQYGDPRALPPGSPYGTSGYGPVPTAPYPIYGGGFDQPPPPGRNHLPIVLSVVTMLVAVSVVVTLVLVNRSAGPTPVAAPSTSRAPDPPARSSVPSRSRLATSVTVPGRGADGWTTVGDRDAGLSYRIPPGWRRAKAPRDTGLGVQLTQGALVDQYTCGGRQYFRGFVASGLVRTAEGSAEVDLNRTLLNFAQSIAGTYYNHPKVDLKDPVPATADGRKAATVTATLAPVVTDPQCDATSGEVAIIGMVVGENGTPAGVALVVVVNDLAGGPATPPGVPDPLAEEILATVRPSG